MTGVFGECVNIAAASKGGLTFREVASFTRIEREAAKRVIKNMYEKPPEQ